MTSRAWFAAACLAPTLMATTGRAQPGTSHDGRPRMSRSSCHRPTWAKDLWPAPQSVPFRPTTLEERAVFSQLFPALLKGAQEGSALAPEWVALAQTVGFELSEVATPGGTLWMLREQARARRGAGAYIVRTGPATQDFIQAPHAYHDLGTGALGAALFSCAPEGRQPRLFATNTAHRYRGREKERPEDADHPADVAHNPEHLFQLVTDLAAKAMPGLRVLQLHGFGRGETEKGAREREVVSAVVSAGSRTLSPGVRAVAASLSPILGRGVRLYPEQTQQLGGTRNAQARLLQSYPSATFVHLELSAKARRGLGSAEQVSKVAEALFAPGGG